MTLTDLAAILGLAVLAMIYAGFRMGERGGCPSCGGPGGCATGDAASCDATGEGRRRGGRTTAGDTTSIPSADFDEHRLEDGADHDGA